MKSFARIAIFVLGVILIASILPAQIISDGTSSSSVSVQPTEARPTRLVFIAAPPDNPSEVSFNAPPTVTPTLAPTIVVATRAPAPLKDQDVDPYSARPRPPLQATPRPAHPFNESELFIHLPPQAKSGQPMRVLFVLHGMGGRGDQFANAFLADADRYGWIVVAPTVAYRDYMDTAKLMEDDIFISHQLADTLDVLPSRLHVSLLPHTLVVGFSRGAQLAHRFAMFHPERVESIASIAAGSYTMPMEKNKNATAQPLLPFPYGIGDLSKYTGQPFDWNRFNHISFLIAVGEKDNNIPEVSRAFDPYEGNNRVERARTFESALRAIGINSRLVVYPNTGHEVTVEMRKNAIQFLREAELADPDKD